MQSSFSEICTCKDLGVPKFGIPIKKWWSSIKTTTEICVICCCHDSHVHLPLQYLLRCIIHLRVIYVPAAMPAWESASVYKNLLYNIPTGCGFSLLMKSPFLGFNADYSSGAVRPLLRYKRCIEHKITIYSIRVF